MYLICSVCKRTHSVTRSDFARYNGKEWVCPLCKNKKVTPERKEWVKEIGKKYKGKDKYFGNDFIEADKNVETEQE